MDRIEARACSVRLPLTRHRAVFLVAIAVALLALVTVLGGCGTSDSASSTSGGASPTSTNATETTSPIAASGLPQLIDLGSDSCIPCQMMAPELKALAAEYAGSVSVTIVDVNKTLEGAAKARRLGVRVIPTQIFIDPAGNELFRHEGYISKDDMVARFEQLGYPLTRVAPVNPGDAPGGG